MIAAVTAVLLLLALGGLLTFVHRLAWPEKAAPGRHRGDLCARLLARRRVLQLERELGWADR